MSTIFEIRTHKGRHLRIDPKEYISLDAALEHSDHILLVEDDTEELPDNYTEITEYAKGQSINTWYLV